MCPIISFSYQSSVPDSIHDDIFRRHDKPAQRIHFSHGPLGAFGPSMLNVEGSHNRDHIYI